MQIDQPSEDLLADEFVYERASTGKRFANYVIDLIVFYVVVVGVSIVIALAAPGGFD